MTASRSQMHRPRFAPAVVSLAALTALVAVVPPGRATELVYVPLNPSFGGSPLNSSLMNSAQAQNKHKDPDSAAGLGAQDKSQLQQFNEILERSILSQLSSAATSGVIGSNGRLVPGTVQTGNFTISISDLGGGMLRVTTTDKTTGAASVFEVSQ